MEDMDRAVLGDAWRWLPRKTRCMLLASATGLAQLAATAHQHDAGSGSCPDLLPLRCRKCLFASKATLQTLPEARIHVAHAWQGGLQGASGLDRGSIAIDSLPAQYSYCCLACLLVNANACVTHSKQVLLADVLLHKHPAA